MLLLNIKYASIIRNKMWKSEEIYYVVDFFFLRDNEKSNTAPLIL